MRAVVVAGSTGEAGSLDERERLVLLDQVRTAVGRAATVIAGTGAPSARQAAALTRAAVDHGADAVLALSPPGAADPLPYYRAVAGAAGDTPLLAYHFPALSPPGIAVEQLAGLPVDAVKDSSGDPGRLLEELAVETALPVYVGAATVLSMAGPLGCQGAIVALANAEPELCRQAFEGDPEAQKRLLPSHLRAELRFPAGLKQLLAERWGTSPVVRLG